MQGLFSGELGIGEWCVGSGVCMRDGLGRWFRVVVDYAGSGVLGRLGCVVAGVD